MKRFLSLALILVFAVLGLTSCNLVPTTFHLVNEYETPEAFYISYKNVAYGIDPAGNRYFRETVDGDVTEHVFMKHPEGGYVQYTRRGNSNTFELYQENLPSAILDYNYTDRFTKVAAKYYIYPITGTKTQLEDTTVAGRDCYRYEVISHEKVGGSYTAKTTYDICIDKETGITMKYEVTAYEHPLSSAPDIVGNGDVCDTFNVTPPNFVEKHGIS